MNREYTEYVAQLLQHLETRILTGEVTNLTQFITAFNIEQSQNISTQYVKTIR